MYIYVYKSRVNPIARLEAVDSAEAADQRSAVLLLEFGQLRPVEQTREHLRSTVGGGAQSSEAAKARNER